MLGRFFSLAKKRAAAIGPEYERLWVELEANTVGGKRFRPRMVFAAYEALGGRDAEAAACIGAAFELLHTALIVHDDVIDRDFVRRGGPNLAGSYRDRALAEGGSAAAAEHRGITAAVIAGDLALFNAYRLIDRSGVGDVVRRRLVEVMDEALFASAAGELIDVLGNRASKGLTSLSITALQSLGVVFSAAMFAAGGLCGAGLWLLLAFPMTRSDSKDQDAEGSRPSPDSPMAPPLAPLAAPAGSPQAAE